MDFLFHQVVDNLLIQAVALMHATQSVTTGMDLIRLVANHLQTDLTLDLPGATLLLMI